MSATSLALATLVAWQAPGDSFPHAAHRRLFTTCASCHAGIATGERATAMPQPQDCASCHDGDSLPRVSWVRGEPRPTSLRFDHREHGREVQGRGDSALACGACHATGRTATVMEVGAATPQRCLDCHAHRAGAHFADATPCASCHRPLREAVRLAARDIGRFPRPPSHDRDYVFAHASDAGAASCSFCHTRETCASCHVNAGALTAIRNLGADPRVAALVRERPPVAYPVPETHGAADFTRGHGLAARVTGATCANCHARESCQACHRPEERIAAVAAMPRRARDAAVGVEMANLRPADHVPGFSVRHRAAGGAGDQACSRCHTPAYCAACHDGSASPAFHGSNFTVRHASPSYTSELECASCHQTAAFCRDCHRATGRASGSGAPAGKFHDAQPAWTFGHGGVARRAIETCAGCHAQADCLQCHSARGGWGVNPHGRGFDAGMGERNRALCLRCHASVPTPG